MKIEEALQRYLNKEVVIYGRAISQINDSALECEIVEIGEGWIRVMTGKDEYRNESVINLANVTRIREFPLNKKGKKKIIYD